MTRKPMTLEPALVRNVYAITWDYLVRNRATMKRNAPAVLIKSLLYAIKAAAKDSKEHLIESKMI